MPLDRVKIASLLASMSIFTVVSCGNLPDENTNDENYIKGMGKATAYSLCKQNVEKKLKAPATAEFEGVTSARISQSEDRTQWSVRMHVDSENGFGALVRTEIACTVKPESPDRGLVESVLI